MNELLFIPIFWAVMLGVPALFCWIGDQIEKAENAKRRKEVGSQPTSQSPVGLGWVILVLAFAFIITLTSGGQGKSAAHPPDHPSSHPAIPSPAAALPAISPKHYTQEFLQSWYDELVLQREALMSGDKGAIQRFNDEAARYAIATAAYVAEQKANAVLPAPTDSGTSFDAYSAGLVQVPVREHYVNPYARKSGTMVSGHYQTNSDNSVLNNYSSAGNVNPHTGRAGTLLPAGTTASGAPHK